MKITESGIVRINELNSSNQKLRVYVKGNGCAGLSYGFEFVESSTNDDIEIDYAGTTIVVDYFSNQLLESAVIDFEDTLTTRRLVLSGLSSCSCMSAFQA